VDSDQQPAVSLILNEQRPPVQGRQGASNDDQPTSWQEMLSNNHYSLCTGLCNIRPASVSSW